MTGTTPAKWMKLDQQEMRHKLMGYGESSAGEESKSKSSSKGLFQSRSRKRMSTAPGSTLPRPFLSDMSISSPLNVTKNPNILASLLSPHQFQFQPSSQSQSQSHYQLSPPPSSPSQSSSYPHFGFTEKRMMRRSRSAQGLVGGMSEFRSEQKIKRKPVPRLSGQGGGPPRGEQAGTIEREETLFNTGHFEQPLQSRSTTIDSRDTTTSVSQSEPHLISPAFLTPRIQDPSQPPYDHGSRSQFHFHSPPTIPTTITSGSLNLGLIPSGSGSSLASSYIEIETPIKDPMKISMSTKGDEKDGQVSPTRRYGSLGIGLDRYMGQAIEGEDEREEDLQTSVITVADKPEIKSHATEPVLFSQNQTSPGRPSRPHRPPGLFLDLSHLKPFALNLKSVAQEEDLSTPASVRLSAISRGSLVPEETATSESSFCALRKDSLDSSIFAARSLRSSVLGPGRDVADGPGRAPARSGLRREIDRSDEGEDTENESIHPGELEDLGKRLRILNEEGLAALDETPKATARLDPFDSNPRDEPYYQRRNSVIAWTQGLSAEVSPALHTGSSGETIKPDSEVEDHPEEPERAMGMVTAVSQEELADLEDPPKPRKTSRGNRQERLLEDGRASRTGYWDYSIIRGGISTPPPPEFFSTFQTSPKTPIMEGEAAFQNRHPSPGKVMTSSPLQRRVDMPHPLEDGADEGNVPPGPRNTPRTSPYTPPARTRLRPREAEADTMTTPQKILKYGIDVLTSPVKLLSPKKRVSGNRFAGEGSGSLLDHAQDMGRSGSVYSSASEYGSEDSPEMGFGGFTTALTGARGQLSLPLLDLKGREQYAEDITSTRSLGAIGLENSDSASLAERHRQASLAASIARSPSSNIDSLSQLDIGLRPVDWVAAASVEQIARFHNAPPIFHFPSPPPSERHQSILSMLSGASKSDNGSRGSQGALLATQMNEARKQLQQQHLSVLEPSTRVAPATPPSKKPGTELGSPQSLSTPPRNNRISAFENAESDMSTTPPRMIQSNSYAAQLQTPKRLSSTAAIAAHGPAISIISPDRNFPRLRSDISHDSPQPLPNVTSRRDIALYPRESIDDVSAKSSLLPSSKSGSTDKGSSLNASQSYREDIRLRPLLQITDDQPQSAKSFTASSQRSEPEDELSERFMATGRWDDVYCACFGRRIC